MNQDIYGKDSIEFVTVAVEYIHFIEQAEKSNREQFTDTAVKILPLLYLKGTLLPHIKIDDDEPLEQFLTEEEYGFMRANIEQIMGDADDYLDVFHPDMPFSDTPIVAYISEDLMDIYQEIKDFSIIYSQGIASTQLQALYTLKENFGALWGQKLVNVLRALHAVRYVIGEDTEDAPLDEDANSDFI